LALAGVGVLGLCDDDVVERSNLHRQVLYGLADVGAPKVEAAARKLQALAASVELRLHAMRLVPENAVELVRDYDLVLEGADNYATKFLAADACALAGVPIVHAAAVRWVGTALSVGMRGRPCYRCVFEDLPATGALGCAEAGVMGPMVGVVAAVQADLALGLLDGRNLAGQLVAFDGRTGHLRRRAIAARTDCPLCGSRAIHAIDAARYSLPADAE
jgi:molybdopterin/thiamine biosynthesis adenylyltransferase